MMCVSCNTNGTTQTLLQQNGIKIHNAEKLGGLAQSARSPRRNHLLPATRRAPEATEHGVGGGREVAAKPRPSGWRQHHKFTTLFGLLAVELAEGLPDNTRHALAVVFGIIMLIFVWWSFYMMRISLSAGVKAAGSSKSAAPASAK
jgi:hypothetical protein